MAISTRVDASDERVFFRGDGADLESPALSLVRLVTLLAGLRSGLVTGQTRHQCNGFNCTRSHGLIDPARALALPCNNFFEDLAGRLGSGALGAAFVALSLDPPAIPEEQGARVQLMTRGLTWSISPRRALGMARAMNTRPEPWFDVLDEALILQGIEATGLHGLSAGTDLSGWFVGFSTVPETRLLAVRVSGCHGDCSQIAVRVARWTLDRQFPPSETRATVPDRSRRPAARRR